MDGRDRGDPETVEIEEPTKDTAMSMEESLLLPKKRSELEGRERLVLTRDVFMTQEAKKLAYIAGPMVVTITSLYLLLVISNMMVDHLGELALSSAAISVSFCNGTGMSLLNGLASANFMWVSLWSSTISKSGTSNLWCYVLPIASLVSLVWINMEKVLILIGQDLITAHEAGRFTLWTVPTLFALCNISATFSIPSNSKFNHSNASELCCHSSFTYIPMLVLSIQVWTRKCWRSISYQHFKVVKCYFSFIVHEIFFCLCKNPCPSFYGDVPWNWRILPFCYPICRNDLSFIHSIRRHVTFYEFLLFDNFSLQRWAYEIAVLLSGLLSNPQLETSVLSVCLTTTSTLYSIPYGIGAAVSTRVSNELGAGRPQAAGIAVYTVMILAIIEANDARERIFEERYSVENIKGKSLTSFAFLVHVHPKLLTGKEFSSPKPEVQLNSQLL
ncbi:LOW QUALITY PROTEIN: hypothetical protein NC651_024523 [Populus alba x Populus x berolinensis]|nr:LOW QUALITY PROTEIN: hypothetical protein NC651_024523 [Populus alba x Populus x berolinensis]